MILKELLNHVDCDLSTLLGEFKIELIGTRAISAQNFIKILNYSNEKIVLKIKNNEVNIEGKDFRIAEMGAKDIVVVGKINKIYMLKE